MILMDTVVFGPGRRCPALRRQGRPLPYAAARFARGHHDSLDPFVRCRTKDVDYARFTRVCVQGRIASSRCPLRARWDPQRTHVGHRQTMHAQRRARASVRQ